MNFLAFLIFASGGYLSYCGIRNKSPKDTLISVLKGNGVPTSAWYHTLVPFTQGGDLGSIGAQGWHAALGDVTGTSAGLGAGSALGSALATSGPARQVVVNFALSQLGEPYLWGASGPDRWDCSGLTMRAYQQVGVKLPHHAASQQQLGHAVSKDQAQIGDLVFWGPVSGHVAIWLGNDQIVEAPHTGDVVKVAPLFDKRHARFRSYL